MTPRTGHGEHLSEISRRIWRTAQPGATILEVNGFLIRGSGRVDDIMLHGEFR